MLEALTLELPSIQKEITAAGVELKQATDALYFFEHPYNPAEEAVSNAPSGEWAAQGAFSEAWAEVGGLDPNLDTVTLSAVDTFPGLVGDFLRRKLHRDFYGHNRGARFFTR